MFIRAFRITFGILIAVVAVWAFAPHPKEDGDDVITATAQRVGREDASIVLEVAPGPYYMPGIIPHGLGEKLTGFVEVANRFVERYPDTAIVFRNVPTADREWLTTALNGGHAPDILFVNVEDVWVDTQKGWYLALDPYLESPNPFVEEGEPGSEQWWDMFRYQAISRGKADSKGRMYCISLDMVETAVFYNKTKFAELGIEPPETWAEFIEIQQIIKDAGLIPFATVVEAISDWGVDLIFDQLYADILPGIDLTKDPVREAYLQGYLDWDEMILLVQKGFFTSADPRYREIYRILYDWRKYWNQDLSVRTMDRYRPFMNQKALMLWDASWFVHRLAMDRTLEFEWDMFYLPPITRETSKFAPAELRPMCVIGGSGQQFSVTERAWSDTDNKQTSVRLQRAVQFLQFMCVPENAEEIINESLQFIPNIVGTDVREEMEPFVEILERRYTTTKWVATFDLQFYDILVRMLALYLNDGCTLEYYLENMDYFIKQAADRAIRRKEPDLEHLQERWEALAPIREGMRGLPDGKP